MKNLQFLTINPNANTRLRTCLALANVFLIIELDSNSKYNSILHKKLTSTSQEKV